MLPQTIRQVRAQDTTMGGPRITAELNDGAGEGQRVNHKRVARVMRAEQIRGYRRRRKVRTTIPEPADQTVPDLLRRDVTAARANQRYVAAPPDITYLPIAAGTSLYVHATATVVDCHSRRLVGWAVANHRRTELVAGALLAAAATGGSLTGAIFHPDHGSVYTSEEYAELCARLGMTQSWVPWARARSTASRRRSTRRRNVRFCRTRPAGRTS